MALVKLNATQGLTGTLPAVSGANLTNIDGGKVLQVVSGVLNSEQSTTATTMTLTSLNVDITPSATTSKILVIMSGPVYVNSGSVYYRGTIYRDSTNLSSTGNLASTRNGGNSVGCSFSMNVLDSPSTTSQITYRYYHRLDSGSGATGYVSINDWTSTITALEIGA